MNKEARPFQHRPSSASVLTFVGSAASKWFYRAQDIDFILSLGGTGVAEMLTFFFDYALWGIMAASFLWMVLDSRGTKAVRYPVWIPGAACTFTAFVIGFLIAFNLIRGASPPSVIDNIAFYYQMSGKVFSITEINIEPLINIRKKGDFILTVLRMEDLKIDPYEDTKIVTSKEFSSALFQDDFSIEVDVSNIMPYPHQGKIEVYAISIPDNKRASDVQKLSDVDKIGGRILDYSFRSWERR